MVVRPRVQISDFEQAVLLAIYRSALKAPEVMVSVNHISSEIEACGGQIIYLCLPRIAEKGFISIVNGLVSITVEGFSEVSGWSDDNFTRISAIADGILVDDDSTVQLIPASDRIVTLSHNQSDYQQAVEALDKVLEEFRNDHRLDNELGPQKDAHLKVLEGGRKALEDKEISVENGQNWIVAPLKWIAEKFADGALKVLAMKALEAIAKLF